MSDRKHGPLIVPIFIPNQGCPHRCIFCDQEKITSQSGHAISKTHVKNVLEQAIGSEGFDPARKPEIAFYGGTFTLLPFETMMDLLETVGPYKEQGFFHGIRVSTRPDALDEERLRIMKDHGVRTVELGVQSMDERVLYLSKRGHSAKDTVLAVEVLRQFGFKVGIQLMPGLPGDSNEIFEETVTQVIGLRPDMVRLYPALVIRGAGLARLYEKGAYQPLSLNEALEICATSCMRLENEGIPVIRMGLMSSPSLLEDGQILAGPWHPAFGFLVRSAIFHRKIEPILPAHANGARLRISVSNKEVPLLRGYKNQGVRKIEASTGAQVVRVDSDDAVPHGAIRVDKI